MATIEIMTNKARHNLIYAQCRWRSDWLDGTGSFGEPLGQTKVMQIRQRETQNHQGTITHEICCLAAQLFQTQTSPVMRFGYDCSVFAQKLKYLSKLG